MNTILYTTLGSQLTDSALRLNNHTLTKEFAWASCTVESTLSPFKPLQASMGFITAIYSLIASKDISLLFSHQVLSSGVEITQYIMKQKVILEIR